MPVAVLHGEYVPVAVLHGECACSSGACSSGACTRTHTVLMCTIVHMHCMPVSVRLYVCLHGCSFILQLQQLKDFHPLPSLVLEHRQVSTRWICQTRPHSHILPHARCAWVVPGVCVCAHVHACVHYTNHINPHTPPTRCTSPTRIPLPAAAAEAQVNLH